MWLISFPALVGVLSPKSQRYSVMASPCEVMLYDTALREISSGAYSVSESVLKEKSGRRGIGERGRLTCTPIREKSKKIILLILPSKKISAVLFPQILEKLKFWTPVYCVMRKIFFCAMLLLASTAFFGCTVQQNLPIKDFSLEYTRIDCKTGIYCSSQTVNVSDDGNFEFWASHGETVAIVPPIVGKLSDEEMQSLVIFVISENKFFDLSADLTVEGCKDAADESLTVTYDGNSYKVSGNCIQNSQFRKIVGKLNELGEKFFNAK